MKSFTHFRFLLLFAIISTYYFVLHCHRAITEEKPKVIIPRPNYKVNLTTVAIPTAPWSLNEILKDYDKLREFFHVDGPLNMTEADLPVMKKRAKILYTYERPPTLSRSFTFGKPACAKSLRKVPGRSKWFNQRFLSTIKLFLDKDDINDWGSFYNLSLCPDHMMGLKNFDRIGLIRLVNNDNYSTTPITNVTSPNKCVRCAVVGNSGVLRGSKAGTEIDSYEYVFRVNTAKIQGFEEDVGSKTSFYSGFPNSVYVKELKNITDVYFICHLSGPYAVPWLEELLNGSMASKQNLSLDFISNGSLINPRKVRVMHPDFIRYFKVRFLGGKGRFPSTGALTAGVALHVCDEIKLFGFGVTDYSFIHYYDELNSSKITNRNSQRKHNFINEWNVWKLVERNHIINRFTSRVKKPKARKKGKR